MAELTVLYIIALFTAVLGALPFGLVNTLVMETSLRPGRRAALAFLASRGFLSYDGLSIPVFLLGILTGKMITLIGYMNVSEKILARSRLISGNINHIIGMVLIGMALIQLIKI